jgi:polysaccharide biosynthesis transport protein
MNFHQFLLALKGRFWVFLSLMAATVLAAIVVTILMPKTYEATASVLVDNRDEQVITQNQMPARAQLGYMQTQVDIIQSQRVARKVVEDLKLADNDAVRADWQKNGAKGTPEDWVAQGLLAKLKVEVSQSSVIGISYAASNSKFAADVANAFAQSYVDTTLRLRTEPAKQASTWFNEQLKGLRADLEKAQARLAAFQREKGILIADERMDIETGRLAELSSQALQATSTSYDNASRYGQASKRNAETLPEVIANPLVTTLKTELLRAESKLSELSTRVGPNHPQYIQQKQEVDALRTRVDAEMGKVAGGLATATAQARAREGALKADLERQRKKVADLRDARAESQILQRDVETSQKAYEAALARFHVNKIEGGARSTNVTVLNPAIEPTFPSKPRVSLNLALGVFVGTLLGLAAIFLLEILDRRVRSDPDLDGVMLGMDVPMLGTLQTWQPSRMLGGDDAPRALPSPA